MYIHVCFDLLHDREIDGQLEDSIESLESLDETDYGGKKKKKGKMYGCSYTEVCARKSAPSWGPSTFSKANHPLQIMVV